MKLVESNARAEIWEVIEDYGHGPVSEFYVYRKAGGDPRICPSLAMARDVAGGY